MTAPTDVHVQESYYIAALETELARVNRERLMLHAAIDQQTAQLTATQAALAAALNGADTAARDATGGPPPHSGP